MGPPPSGAHHESLLQGAAYTLRVGIVKRGSGCPLAPLGGTVCSRDPARGRRIAIEKLEAALRRLKEFVNTKTVFVP